MPRGPRSVEVCTKLFKSRIERESCKEHTYFSRYRPEIPLHKYLVRLEKYLSPDWVSVLILIDRVRLKTRFCKNSVHRLILSALVVSDKFHNDHAPSNQYYAQVGGVKLKELNRLEVEYLTLCKWRINITPEQHQHYKSLLDNELKI